MSFYVVRTATNNETPTCTYCFGHCMIRSKIDANASPPTWVCKALHPDDAVRASLRAAFAQ
eukprot:3697453-Amphidinium_carterae.1